MKTHLIIAAAAAALLAAGCQPEDRPTMGGRITDLKIVVSPAETPNTYTLTAAPADVIGFWDLGNGVKVNGESSVTAEYPFPGDYTVTLDAYGEGGRTNSVSITIPVTKSNFDLLSDPVYALISGGINNPEGKTWVVDSMLKGHLVLKPSASQYGDWAALPATYENRGNNKVGADMYDDEATFLLTDADGPAFLYKNNGASLASNTQSNACVDQLFKDKEWGATAKDVVSSYFTGGTSDVRIKCTPPSNMKWTLIKDGAGTYWISFPALKNGYGGFLFYFTDWLNNYQIKLITEDRMVLWKKTTINGANSERQIVLIRQGTPSGLELQYPL